MSTPTIEIDRPVVEPDRGGAGADRRFLLTGIRWATYEALLADIGDRSIRLSFDRGDLEIMSPGVRHEGDKSRFGRLIEALTEELDIDLFASGSTTLRKERLEQGLEPDESYYLQNESKVRDREDLDFEVDPPPDLAVEIDITRSSVDRQGIYAALGVPELWRFDGTSLRVFRLDEGGHYQPVKSSPTFPYLPLDEFAAFHHPRPREGQTAWAKRFKAWVRERVAPLHRAWKEGPDAW